MAEFQKFYGPITLVGHESREWANINVADIATKGEVDSQITAAITANNTATRGGSVASGNTKDVTGGTVYSYIDTNSTTTGGSGKNGKLVKLDANGLIDNTMIPSLAITDTFTAANATAMTGLSNAKKGDICIRTDENKTYILTSDAANAYATASNWTALATPTDAVLSVCSKTGAVTLSASDVGAIASTDLVTSVSSESDDTKVPSAKAVYTFVNTNYSASGHTHTSANITDSVSAATGVTPSAAGLAQAKAVYDYAAPKSHTHASADINNSISASSGITSSAAGLVQGKAVEAYAAKKVHTHALSDIIYTGSTGYTAGTTISNTSTDGALATAKAVYDYVDGLSLATTYAAKSHTHVAADLPTATDSDKGIASFGTGLTVSSGAVTLSAATADALGGVKVGSGNGLAYSSNKITMSLANGTSAGTVKASTGITISSGNISVNFSTDISTDASSDVKAATPKAVKTYVDNAVGAASAIGTITGNGSAKKFEIAHSLGTSIIVQVVDSDGNTVYVPVTRASGKITVEFASAPANNTTFSVYITKVDGTAIAATVASA